MYRRKLVLVEVEGLDAELMDRVGQAAKAKGLSDAGWMIRAVKRQLERERERELEECLSKPLPPQRIAPSIPDPGSLVRRNPLKG
jgi:hypothetical protein